MTTEAAVLRASEYAVRAITHKDAADFIREHHYARGCANTSVLATGLFAGGALLGASLWMPPTRVCAESVAGEGWRGVLALSRLAVAPGVPTNGASFLIGRSIRLLRRDPRWTHLVTYADESQGHTGAIYHATNWTPQGRTRPEARWLTADGAQVSRKAGRSRTRAEMEDLGHRLEGRFAKLKFTMALRKPTKDQT